MKQILDYLKLKKLGATVLPPFEKFEGLVAAKVSRRGMENFVVAKWNEDFLTPDVAFDPNTNFGMVDEFLELYSSEEVNKPEEDLEDEFTIDLELVNNNEEVDEELGSEELESKEAFPIFEALKSDELSEWLSSHSISHKTTLSKPEKVKLCEKYVAYLVKSE